MEGHGRDLSPLERSRLLSSSGLDPNTTNTSANSGGNGSTGGGSGPGLTPVSEFVSRTATPTPLTSLAAQYNSRYGLPPALPAHSYSLMSSFLSSAHSAEARKTLMPEFQHYWGEAAGVQRYLMGGLYPPYTTLFPAAESLSLLGAAGVAGAAPAPAHHTAHYQRLVEMQKEAYIASMSAHHPLYALPPSALPTFVETHLTPHVQVSTASTASSSSSSTSPAAHATNSNNVPLSLVKQEPRDLSCAEKVARHSERRSMGVKVDLDKHHPRSASQRRSISPSAGATARPGTNSDSLNSSRNWTAALKEPKLSPSAAEMASPQATLTVSVVENRGAIRTVPRGNDESGDTVNNSRAGTPRAKVVSEGVRGNNVPAASSTKSISPSRGVSGSVSSMSVESMDGAVNYGSTKRSTTPAPAHKNSTQRTAPNMSSSLENNPVTNQTSGANNGPSPRKSGKSLSQVPSSISSSSSSSRQTPRSSPAVTDMPVPSVPTKLAPPIALATMQHDGILLSALASPSSAAAACSAAAKTVIVQQQVTPGDGLAKSNTSGSTSSGSVHRSGSNSASLPSSDTSFTSSLPPNSSDQILSSGGVSHTRNDMNQHARTVPDNKITTSSDDNASDIIVDSTESDEVISTCDMPPRPSQPPSIVAATTSTVRFKSDQERAIEETIQRVVDGTDCVADDGAVTETTSLTKDRSSSDSQRASRSSGTTGSLSNVNGGHSRTVYAKTQPVPAMSATGTIPVGIAVAKIRPHHVHQPRAHTTDSGGNRDHGFRHTSPTVTSRHRPGPSLLRGNTSQQANLSQATGHRVQPSTLTPTVAAAAASSASSSSTSSPRYPVSAPPGFKFSVDPASGQIFLVQCHETEPTESLWTPVNVASPTDPNTTQSAAVPTVTVHSPERTEERPSNSILPHVRRGPQGHPFVEPASQLAAVKPQSHESMNKNSINSNSGNRVSSSAASNIELANPAWRPLESRGCSPILVEDLSSPLSLLSALSSLSSKKPTTCTVSTQASDGTPARGKKRRGSPLRHSSVDRGVQTSPPPATASATSPIQQLLLASSSTSSSPTAALNPLSVHCPGPGAVRNSRVNNLSMQQPLEVKIGTEDSEDAAEATHHLYNPFTDPQILQAADGLELLSTLAEKRPKCSSSSAPSSLDDPKLIYPSPSDSFDTLSPSGEQCTDLPGNRGVSASSHFTARHKLRKEMSPKWMHPKAEPQDGAAAGDFKPPPRDLEMQMVQVQRQYKEKKKELAKLSKKTEHGTKPWKRGPGRPPKKKTNSKKSDDGNSSSSSKGKDGHPPQQKKKRPTEELVDRIYRKLAPEKPNKVSRSIHYVKSKTGPFFRRKSASKSVKRNKDLFGGDPSAWPSYSEGKHQENKRHSEHTSDGSHKSHFSFKSKSHKSKYIKDSGNIFSNLQKSCSDSEFSQSPLKPAKSRLTKQETSNDNSSKISSQNLISSSTGASMPIKTESGGTANLFATLAITTTNITSSAAPVTSFAGTGSNLQSSTTTGTSAAASASSTPSNMVLANPGSSGTSANGTSVTFGSASSLVSGTNLFNSHNNGNILGTSRSFSVASFSTQDVTKLSGTSNSSTFTTTATTSIALLSSQTMTTAATTATSSSASVTSNTNSINTNSGRGSSRVNGSNNITASGCGGTSSTTSSGEQTESSSHEEASSGASGSGLDHSAAKRKPDDDSDTDASETSPNKKRKPGRPRKINPEKSSAGTETIWSKKSYQSPDSSSQGDNRRIESDFNTPLFLDEEWNRRRSERIFLSETVTSTSILTPGSGSSSGPFTSSPCSTLTPPPPPSALSPRANSADHSIWKLSNFMPKKQKQLETTKSQPSSDLEKAPAKVEKKEEVLMPSTSQGNTGSGSSKRTKAESKKVKPSSHHTNSRDSSSGSSYNPSGTASPSSISPQKPEKSKRGRKPKLENLRLQQNLKKGKEVSSPPLSPPKLTGRGKKQNSGSLLNITQRVKKKFSKAKKPAEESSKGKVNRNNSNKDVDLLDVEGPPTPEPRSCKLQTSDLREGLKVLYHNDGLFYEGVVKALQPPDVYGVLTAGQRGSRPHILCQEEVLKDAVLDVKPGSKRFLTPGTRVCAFWSQQFSCLYPGTVAKRKKDDKDSSSDYSDPEKVLVNFDDEDTGTIPIAHVRLLPSDFPVIEYTSDPLESVPKRRRRTQSDLSETDKSKIKSRKRSNSDVEVDDEEDEEEDNKSEKGTSKSNSTVEESDNSQDSASDTLYWQWHGEPIRRPGQKGKLVVKGKRVYYQSIIRDGEIISVGDSAEFISSRGGCPYIGSIESLWATASGTMKVNVRWYYHPSETETGEDLSHLKNALFTSTHMDENEVQTIANRIDVMTAAQYHKSGQPTGEDVFYCAGHYDPVSHTLTKSPGVL